MSRARPIAVAALVLLGGGCAPTTVAPAIIRLPVDEPTRATPTIGLRTGPRLSTGVSPGGNDFAGDANSFAFPQWSAAYDLSLRQPLGARTALHFGVQGEFYYPLPFPAYGLFAGLSSLIEAGALSIAPSVCARGATDFGLSIITTSSASTVGGEASVTFSLHPERKTWLGLTPFVAVQEVYATREATALYAGAVLVGRFEKLELSAGFGRVLIRGGESWNVPLIGLRASE